LEPGADLHITVNPDWNIYLPGFTFLVPAHLGSPEQKPEGHKTVVVVVVVSYCFFCFWLDAVD